MTALFSRLAAGAGTSHRGAEQFLTCFAALIHSHPRCPLCKSTRPLRKTQRRPKWMFTGDSSVSSWRRHDSQGLSEHPVHEHTQEDFYLHALLLLFFASQNRPMVATRAFVEVGLDMYLEGISLSEMEAMMAVARLESGGQLVGPLQQEILLSWSAMVFLTLQAIGLPLRPSGEARRAKSLSSTKAGQMEQGMASFVKQTIGMYRSGFDSRRMLLQQSLAEFTKEAGSMSGGQSYMQQNTRLVVLTLEAVRESGMAVEAQLEPSVLTSAAGEDTMSSGSLDVTSSSADSSSDEGPPLSPPAQYEPTKWHTSAAAEPAISASSEGSRRADGSQGASTSGGQPVDYIFSFLPQWRQQEIATAQQATVEYLQLRSVALYLLMAFIGGQAQSLYAVQSFVKRALRCYRQGLSVQELYEQLTDEEKYQGVGGALQVKAPNPADQHRISGHVFAQWLSIVYMTFAQMGAPVGQGNERKEGWAWVDTQPGQDTEILEAYRLADLVSNTLRLEAEREAVENGLPWPGSSAAEAALREHFSGEEGTKAVEQQVKDSGGIVVIEDPSLRSTSPMLIMISQFTGLVKLAKDLILSEQKAARDLPAAH